MGQPFVGEIRMFGGNFAPAGWAFCNGALVPISENEVLFVLIGTTYGGDGEETFALPDLQGRIPIHQGTGPGLQPRALGEKEGSESVTLTTNQLPVHTHPVLCSSNAGNQSSPAGSVWAASGLGDQLYSNFPTSANMNTGTVLPAGGSQPHDNMHPFLVISFIISLFGIFPSQ